MNNGTLSTMDNGKMGANNWRPELVTQSAEEPEMGPIVRPRLDVSEHEMLTILDREDSAFSNALYDFSTMTAWCNHPVRDCRPTDIVSFENTHPYGSVLDIIDAVRSPASGCMISVCYWSSEIFLSDNFGFENDIRKE